MAVSTSSSPLVFRILSARCSSPNGGKFSSSQRFAGSSNPFPPMLSAPSLRFSVVAVSSRRKKNASSAPAKTVSSKLKTRKGIDDEEGDDIDEDAIEALFSLLEEDLRNEGLSDDVDDEITEEDLANLEKELEDALGEEDHDDISGGLPLSMDGMDGEDEDDVEKGPPKLKNWQVRRLANALKIGRRKASIKNLAAELGLERALVLDLLRDPPPNLLLMCASLPDELKEKTSIPESEPAESPPIATVEDSETKPKPEVKAPIHVLQSRWSMQKRLKKVQIETLERVYSRTKRPTNAMINSIIHVTNLPRKRVVKWFEEKRLEDEVPEHRAPFRRSMPETV